MKTQSEIPVKLTSENESGERTFTAYLDGSFVTITMRCSDSDVNYLTFENVVELEKILDIVACQNDIDGVIITTGQGASFLEGFPLSVLKGFHSKEAAESASLAVQKLSERIANLTVPVVACIHGRCVSGGLDIALAAQVRIASDSSVTQIGFPEVHWGVIPWGGGIRRLVKVAGLASALDILIDGNLLSAAQAYQFEIVREILPSTLLIGRAKEICLALRSRFPRQLDNALLRKMIPSGVISALRNATNFKFGRVATDRNPVGRALIESRARQRIAERYRGFHPAPYKMLSAALYESSMTTSELISIEARFFSELVMSNECRALLHLASTVAVADRNPCSEEVRIRAVHQIESLARGTQSVGVIGASRLGAGITAVLAAHGFRCVLVDERPEWLERGLAIVTYYLDVAAEVRRMTGVEKEAARARILPTVDFDLLKSIPFVIDSNLSEPVSKVELLRRYERSSRPGSHLLAFSTASFPAEEIYRYLEQPERAIGVQFLMPITGESLVELSVGEKTDEFVTAMAFELARKIGKHVIFLKRGRTGYVPRLFATLVVEALYLLHDGASIDTVDEGLMRNGFRFGVFSLLDRIDVSFSVVDHFVNQFGKRLALPEGGLDILSTFRRTKRELSGFYHYSGRERLEPNVNVYKFLHSGDARKRVRSQTVYERCLFLLMNEAARCLDERVIESADAGDVGAVFGIGFPEFLGGPFHHAQQLGKEACFKKLQELQSKHGGRFEPAAWWSKV